jgi:hypothetical protein
MAGVYFFDAEGYGEFVHIPWDEVRKIERCDSYGFCVTLSDCPQLFWVYLVRGDIVGFDDAEKERLELRLRTLYCDIACPDIDVDITYIAEPRKLVTGETYSEYVRTRGRPQRNEAQLPKGD